MGRKSLSETEKLHQIQAAVPLPVKNILETFAVEKDQTVSRVVRRLLEESPRLKAVLRAAKKNGNKRSK